MKISTAFPSKYLRAADLPENGQVDLVIANVQLEDVGDDDQRPVLYFQGKTKGVVLNKTNSGVISNKYGDETDKWLGQPIALYATETSFQGKMVACIRMRTPKAPAGNPEASVTSEDIPF